MELKLNDKTLRKILIGVAIVAVIILIVNGLYRRSNYVFPPTDTAQEDNTCLLYTSDAADEMD
jgi:FtsZ-interacting cell division protein ZipA